ncbi:hypothetical protein D6T69_13320 [Tenacibaculum singaporense]|uniref:Uncharacterized protein n=2 Tax=Tenacibaculum TaxID=104267 RepID=A0A3Q8RSM3_9FLAO|nr:hypothetical protein [Tenacibaculum singaporense]AZJ36448.1 hypothetical protein D6T69_13320 [Tenacibaculum singaporense]
MRKNEIVSFNKYYAPNRILVVTSWNKLISLHCPFPVQFLYNVDRFKKNQIVIVEATALAQNGKYVFKIKGKWFFYYHFEILCYNI